MINLPQVDRQTAFLPVRRSSGLRRVVDAFGLTFLVRAVRTCLAEVRVLLFHWRSQFKARRFRDQTQLMVHFGCGPEIRPGWVNVDLDPRADLQLDLRKPLPLASGSCALTHSEHFLEHLDFPDEALRFVAECFRVTARGGRISVGVPDAGAMLLKYASARRDPQAPFQPWPFDPPWASHWIDRVNFLFRLNTHYFRHEHRYAYDYEKLAAVLTSVGFVNVRTREFDPATDTEARRWSTLYVEAFRP